MQEYAIKVVDDSGKEGIFKGTYKVKGKTKLKLATIDCKAVRIYKSKGRADRGIRLLKLKVEGNYHYEAIPWPRLIALDSLEVIEKADDSSPHGKWICSKNADDEVWNACEFYNFRFQAIEAAKRHLIAHNKGKTKVTFEDVLGFYPEENEQYVSFAVGQCVVPDVSVDVDYFLESTADAMFESSGEIAEEYLDDVTDEHKEELAKLIQDWFIRHDYKPSFYNIQNTQQILINE